MVEAALQGCGLAYVYEHRVLEHLARGTLIRRSEDWCAHDDTLFLYYPSRRQVSAGLRALINMLRWSGVTFQRQPCCSLAPAGPVRLGPRGIVVPVRSPALSAAVPLILSRT